jgi:hypothetical protein
VYAALCALADREQPDVAHYATWLR